MIDIYEWWKEKKEKESYIRTEYEFPTYGLRGFPLQLKNNDQFKPNELNNLSIRAAWMNLFLLGCLHTMGRTQPEQHRDFIHKCQNKGWIDVFADSQIKAEKWINVLEEYCEEDDDEYKQWMKQFITIFRLSRWLKEYAEAFLSIKNKTQKFDLNSITMPKTNQDFQGTGINAPSIKRELGIGACFIIRELIRKKIIDNSYAYEHCYVPVKRVRNIFGSLGCYVSEKADIYDSKSIYNFLAKNLEGKDFTFDLCFDIPFLIIADDKDLKSRFFNT